MRLTARRRSRESSVGSHRRRAPWVGRPARFSTRFAASMRYRVEIAGDAADNFEQILVELQRRAPGYADRRLDGLYETIERLARFPTKAPDRPRERRVRARNPANVLRRRTVGPSDSIRHQRPPSNDPSRPACPAPKADASTRSRLFGRAVEAFGRRRNRAERLSTHLEHRQSALVGSVGEQAE